MIASLRGTVTSIGLDHVVVECAGVGYHAIATAPTLSRFRRGEEATVLTAMVVREDAMLLYGFATADERGMFYRLQSVSGLGPKLAMATLSTLQPQEISAAVANEDTKRLQTVPGVGKRMADRMIVELKDKLDDFLPASEPGAGENAYEVSSSTTDNQLVDQVTEALVGLGFVDKQARPVVEEVVAADDTIDTATALRTALSALGKK